MSRPTGTQIRIIRNSFGEEHAGVVADVIDLLSTQFTVRYGDGTETLSYQFYSNEGHTWENWK